MTEDKAPGCILVVEDDIIIRQPLAAYLRECGYKVFEANDSDEAVKILEDGAVLVDVVLCDVNSAGKLNGFALSRWVKANNLPAKVILAGSADSAAEKAGDLCDDGPLQSKPYDHKALLDRIKRLLAERDRNA